MSIVGRHAADGRGTQPRRVQVGWESDAACLEPAYGRLRRTGEGDMSVSDRRRFREFVGDDNE